MRQARTRIQHLLSQINGNPALLGVSGLRELQHSWRNPDRQAERAARMQQQARSPTVPGPAPVAHTLPPPLGRHGHRRADNGRPRINQPRLTDSVDAWVEWLRRYPTQVPAWVEYDQAGLPVRSNIEYQIMVRRPVRRGTPVADRGRFVYYATVLFSVPGLYRSIVQRGGYPLRPEYQHGLYTGSFDPAVLNIFQVARFFAATGVSFAMADSFQRAAHHARAHWLGMDPSDVPQRLDGVNEVTDIYTVPSIAEL
ncbi:hypothetical protein FKP32DRAFT_1541778, partial [Trametes sanguinea]